MGYIEDFKKNIDNNYNKIIYSKFLSAEEQAQLKKINNIIFFPEDCERRRVIINYILNNDDKDDLINNYISIIKISYNKKFGNITHRDVLGALIGLGIKRECIGDILIDEDIYVYVVKEMADYIINTLSSVGKVSVTCKYSDINEVNSIKVENYIEKTIIVSSYRLDNIISEICCLSREKAKQYIILKNVKINGIININPDYNVKIDDLISIHRFGRVIVKEEVNKTKKDKYVLKVLKTK